MIKRKAKKYKSYKILITWRLLIQDIGSYKNILKKNNIYFDILNTKQYTEEEKLLKIIHKYDGIICGDDEITKKVINKAKYLKVISKWGTGIDSIDREYLKLKNITLINSPGAFTKSVAQHALALMFCLNRNIVANHNDIKDGLWTKRICSNLEEKKIGIIGYGKIGREIHKNLKPFNSKFLINDVKKIKGKVNLSFLLKNSDIIFVSCDLNKKSKNLIDYKKMILMKKTSKIINISRGAIINNQDLAKCLKKKIISGAGLDVFDKEPIDKKSKFLELDNCILTSHNAFNSENSIKKINKKSVGNIINFFKNFKK